MKRNYFVLLLLIALLGGSQAQAQRCAWALGIPKLKLSSTAHALATDAAGNSYVAAQFAERLIIGTDTLQASANDLNVLIAKYDSAHHLLWARSLASPGNDYPITLALDAAGSVFLAGYGNSGFTAGGYVLNRACYWLTKISSGGTVQWVRPLQAGVGSYFEISSMATDGAGNCYIGGRAGTVDSLGALPFQNEVVGFVAKVNVLGTVTALHEFSANTIYANVGVTDLALDSQNNVLCTGWYSGQVRFGPQSSQVLYGVDSVTTVFVAKLSGQQIQTRWVRSGYALPGLTGSSGGIAIGVDAIGNCYVAGESDGSLCFSPTLYNAIDGVFLVKLNPQGTPQWLRTQTTSRLPWADGVADLVVDAAGTSYLAGYYSSPTIGFGNQTIGGGSSATGNRPFIVSHTATGGVRWLRTSELAAPPPPGMTATPNALGLASRDRLFLLGTQASLASGGGTGLTFDDQTAPGPGLYLARFDPSAQVTGQIYFDQNGNGSRDSGESLCLVPVIVQDATTQSFFSSNPDGSYTAYLPAGSFALSIPTPPPHYTSSAPVSGTLTGQVTATSQLLAGYDFGLAPIPNQADVRVTVTAYSPARRGFITRYRVTLENVGTTTASGALTLALDTLAQFVSALPTTTVSGQVLTWSYANLAPFAVREFDVQASLPVNVPLGTPLRLTAIASLATDVSLADNENTLTQLVVGSYDPNSIEVNYVALSPQQVADGLPLDYTIRFQNMGNDTAFSVIIRDTLPAGQLVLSTVRLVAQSHNCTWTLSGSGVMTVRFPGIRLPFRNLDALRSQGYVRFRVTPKQGLTLGTLIPNKAHIYFDFNAPVPTNQAVTVVAEPNGIDPADTLGSTAAQLYPNPATSAVTLTADLPTSGLVKVKLTDGLGRTLRSLTMAAAAGAFQHRLELSGVIPGLYAVSLIRPDGRTLTHKLLVSE